MKKLLGILLLALLSGCNVREVRCKLDDVESYIAERPDSALAVLESIDSTALCTKELKAHHALLHAMALDKNYIDVADDSLANIAVKYYQKRGPQRNLARSLYYQALSYFNGRKYDMSIIKLMEAEKVAQNSDSLYLAFIKVLQADIHSVNHDGVSECDALVEALNIYTDVHADKYISIVRHRIARALMNNEKYNDAKEILEDLLNTENLKQSTLTYAIGDYAFLLGTCPDPDYHSSNEYYKKRIALNPDNMTTQDYWVWAYALSEIGNREKSHKLVNDLRQIDSSCTACYFMYKIAKNEERYGDALKYLEKFTAKNNDEVVQVLKQSISVAQKDYYQSQYLIADYKATNRLLIIIVFGIVTIIVLFATILFIARYRKKKEIEKNEYIRYAEEIGRQLKDLKNNSYSELQKKYVLMYKSKYETLRSLYERYMMSGGRVDADKIMYREVVRLINELRCDIQDSNVLEKMLDEDLGGIMTSLNIELPDLSKKDHTLIGYLALGFDSVLISHFMNTSPNAIYIRKSRLKKVIEESDVEHRAVFLEIIG